MQEGTLRKVARVCNEAVDRGQYVQPIDLDMLQPEQRQSFLATLHSSSVTRSNIVILDESAAVFRGGELEAKAFQSMLIEESARLESEYLQTSACTLQRALQRSYGYGIAFSLKTRQEAQSFIAALFSGLGSQNREFLHEEVERLQRELHMQSSRSRSN